MSKIGTIHSSEKGKTPLPNISFRPIYPKTLKWLSATVLVAALFCSVFFLNSCDDSHEKRMACGAGNLKTALNALMDYAEIHDGMLPSDDIWQQAVEEYCGMKNITQCPIDGSPYKFFGNGIDLRQYDAPSDKYNRILLLCPREHCHNELHVGFADGHLNWSARKELVDKAVRECAQGQLPCITTIGVQQNTVPIPQNLICFRRLFDLRLWVLIPLAFVWFIVAIRLLLHSRKVFFVWLFGLPFFIMPLCIFLTWCGWHYRMELRQRFAAYSSEAHAYSLGRMPANIRAEYARNDYHPRFRDIKAQVLFTIAFTPILLVIGFLLFHFRQKSVRQQALKPPSSEAEQ